MKRRVGIVLGIAVLIGVALIVLLFNQDPKEVRAQNHYERGQELLAAEEPVKAVLEFRNALKLQEDFTPARFSLAKIYEKTGNLRGAVANYRAVTDFDKGHLEARIRLGRIMLLAGENDLALEYSNAANLIDDTNVDVLALRASVAFKLGNSETAIQLAKQAIQLDPTNIDAHAVLVAERLGAKEFDQSLALLETALVSNKDNITLLLLKVVVFEQKGDNAMVGKALLKLIDVSPNPASFQQALVNWHLRAGDSEAAEQVLRDIAKDNQENSQASLNIVRFLARTKGIDATRNELGSLIDANDQVTDYKLALAQLEYTDGKPLAAIAILRDVISQEEDQEKKNKAKVSLAQILLEQSDEASATELVTSILEADERNVDALAIKASIALMNDQVEDAIEDLRIALNESPQSTRLMLLLADAHQRNGSIELAEDRLAAATRASNFDPVLSQPYIRFLLGKGNLDAAENVVEKIILRNPKDKRALTELAQIRLNQKDWEGARQAGEALRELDERDEASERIIAAALSGQERYAESIDILKDLTSRSQNLILPMAELVQTYLRAKEPEKAEEYLNGVLADDPGNAQAKVILGLLYMATSRPDDSEKTFKSIIASDPKSLEAYTALSRLYISLDRMEEAETVIVKALELQPNSPRLLLSMAVFSERKEDYRSAVDYYEKIYQLQPGSVVVANNLASLVSEHFSEDQEQLERAYKIAKRFRTVDIPQFQDTLGWIQYLRGEHGQAITLLKPAAEKLVNNPYAQYHLAMAYRKLNKNALAAEYLEKAIKLSENSSFTKLEEAKTIYAQLAAGN